MYVCMYICSGKQNFNICRFDQRGNSVCQSFRAKVLDVFSRPDVSEAWTPVR